MAKLPQATDLKLRRLLSDWVTLGYLIGLAVLGVALMVVAEHTSDASHPVWRALLLGWGGLFIATATVSLFWELWGRRAFSQEVLAAAGVAADARQAGLRAISDEYLQVADWPDLFHSAHEIDLFASWGSTWRQTHEARWTEWIKRRNVRLRVLLPDPNDAALLTHLAQRFDKEEGYVRGKIEETTAFYQRLQQNAGDGATVEVRHLVRAPVWGYYRMGGTIVATLYPSSLASAPGVPALVFDTRGSTGQFFVEQFDLCWDEAA